VLKLLANGFQENISLRVSKIGRMAILWQIIGKDSRLLSMVCCCLMGVKIKYLLLPDKNNFSKRKV
jgi:hypothetical protein